MPKQWRPVPGWPYESGVLDGVAVVRRLGSSRPLRVTVDGDGYERVTLSRVRAGKRERKTFGVHQVMALSWLGPPEVLHGAGGQRDNRPGNLRWGSRRVNELDKSSFTRVNKKEGKGTERYKEEWVAPPLHTVSPVSGEVQG